MPEPTPNEWDFDFISAEMDGLYVVAEARFRCRNEPVCTKLYRWRGGPRFNADTAVAEVRADLAEYASGEGHRQLHARIKEFAEAKMVFRMNEPAAPLEPPAPPAA